MPKPDDKTKLQAACEKLEHDLVNLTDLLRDIQVHGAEVNTYALLSDEPTINFQVHMPDLREHTEGLFDQLSNIEAWKEDRRPEPTPSKDFSVEIVNSIHVGLRALTNLSGLIDKKRRPWDSDRDLSFDRSVLQMYNQIGDVYETYQADTIVADSPEVSLTATQVAQLLHLIFALAAGFGMDLSQAYLEWAKATMKGEPFDEF